MRSKRGSRGRFQSVLGQAAQEPQVGRKTCDFGDSPSSIDRYSNWPEKEGQSEDPNTRVIGPKGFPPLIPGLFSTWMDDGMSKPEILNLVGEGMCRRR